MSAQVIRPKANEQAVVLVPMSLIMQVEKGVHRNKKIYASKNTIEMTYCIFLPILLNSTPGPHIDIALYRHSLVT